MWCNYWRPVRSTDCKSSSPPTTFFFSLSTRRKQSGFLVKMREREEKWCETMIFCYVSRVRRRTALCEIVKVLSFCDPYRSESERETVHRCVSRGTSDQTDRSVATVVAWEWKPQPPVEEDQEDEEKREVKVGREKVGWMMIKLRSAGGERECWWSNLFVVVLVSPAETNPPPHPLPSQEVKKKVSGREKAQSSLTHHFLDQTQRLCRCLDLDMDGVSLLEKRRNQAKPGEFRPPCDD